MDKEFIRRSIYENTFWLQILQDHSRFMLTYFSHTEKADIAETQMFLEKLGEQYEKVRSSRDQISEGEMEEINDESHSLAFEFVGYQQHLLDRKLVYDVILNMSPDLLEHMIREGSEFIRQLEQIKAELEPDRVRHAMHQNKLWISDAAAHAALIKCSLDETEKELSKRAEGFETDFQDLFIKSYELKKMLRPAYKDIPAVAFLNEQNMCKIKAFLTYLDMIKELVEEKKVLSELIPLIPDHMIREEHYYINKLKEAHPELKE
ncbi:MAG: DUF2935 domain-containing protein [Caulobacteraceae bacterium]